MCQPSGSGSAEDMSLDSLYQRVVHDHRRLEVSLPQGDCVIISKDELDALERALEILADSDDFRTACASIDHLCELCREPTRV